jgi:uncharacterized protein YraI
MRYPRFWIIALAVMICLSVTSVFAQEIQPTNVVVLVNRDGVNVRLFPAIGAEVLGFVNAGYTAQVYARSPDNEWVKIRFAEEEGWIGLAVLNILEGDLNTVPVADPRTIPYGGFESPRAGLTSADSPIRGRLDSVGVRVRAGPSRAYPVLANAPRRSEFALTGRTFNNAWFQVNYQGTLGWVAARFITLTDVFDITTLPVDGIVAEGLIESQPTRDDYVGTLRLLLARIDLAQPSLDAIRAIWTDVALGGQAQCGVYPPQPTDYNIPNPLLAAFYDTLNPLQRDFNDAMFNIRLAIDLLIDLCNRPQPQRGSVGQAAVQGALNAINLADAQFIALRQRLNELIPPDRVPGANECLFTFEGESDILALLQQNVVYIDQFTRNRIITGYCFDATQGQAITVSLLRFDANLGIFAAVSPIDNPTSFLGVGQIAVDQEQVSMSFTAPTTGRYLIIATSNVNRGALAEEEAAVFTTIGGFAVLVFNGGTVDPNAVVNLTGGEVTGDVSAFIPAAVATISPVIVPTAVQGEPGTADFCPGLNLTCGLLTCEQAVACLRAGNFTLDPDNDRIPCEENGCTLVAN